MEPNIYSTNIILICVKLINSIFSPFKKKTSCCFIMIDIFECNLFHLALSKKNGMQTQLKIKREYHSFVQNTENFRFRDYLCISSVKYE